VNMRMATENDGEHCISRRRMLVSTVAASGALVLSALLASSRSGRATENSRFNVTAWTRIDPNNTVTLIASQSEMGQGASTTLAAVLADELYLPLDGVKIEFAPFDPAYRDPVYNWMFTGNSQSLSSFYDPVRRMGAAARQMLLQAASQRLRVDPEALSCENGVIRPGTTNRSVTFGEVAADAAKLSVPANPVLRTDVPQGRSVSRWDIPSKVDGSAVFGIDMKLPGMVVGAVRCAPRFGASLVGYDAAAIKAKPGIVAVVEVPHGLAVVANSYWLARRALDSAQLEWGHDGSILTSGAALSPEFREKLTSGPFFIHKEVGDVAGASAPRRAEAVYQLPFQAHATMEPMNCTAHITDGRCEIWAPTQGMELPQNVAMQITGLPSDKIVIHRTFLGGGFGRRLLADFIVQTLVVAKALGRPVKLMWSREEDMTHDFYRPGMLHRISGKIDERGKAITLSHHVVSPSHMLYIFPRELFPQLKDWSEPVAPPEKFDQMAVEGLVDVPYGVPNQVVAQHRLEISIPVSVWRTTGHGPNNFVLESFIDELATLAKADPIAFRRNLLANNPRALAIIDLAARKANWGTPLNDGAARGVALAAAFGGYVASVVELSVAGAKISLRRIICAVDCGRPIDPSIAESNILGGIVWGLSAMRTAMTFVNGEAVQSNFDEFEPFHLWETPPCEVHFIDSGEKLGGTGELGPVAVPAAVCNAIFAATGRRIRTLPLSDSGLSFA
jgi:isoquinoline 1-oxidoreductase subunit beta